MSATNYQVRELLLSDGKSPYAEWFASLDALTAAKVRVAAARMEQGNLSNVEWFRGIGEYKIDWGPGYRIYLAKDGLKIIILLGGGARSGSSKTSIKLSPCGKITNGANYKRQKVGELWY